MTLLLLIGGVGLVAGYVLHRSDSKAGIWLILASIIAIALLSIANIHKELTGRPLIGEEFDTAVAWALADALSTDIENARSVVVLQDPIYKTTPSYEAQRAGIRQGLRGNIKPIFIDIKASAKEGETLDPKKIRDALAAANIEADALISLTPLAEILSNELAEGLPPLYLMELESSKAMRYLLKKKIARATVVMIEGANMAVKPSGNPASDFALRHKILRPE